MRRDLAVVAFVALVWVTSGLVAFFAQGKPEAVVDFCAAAVALRESPLQKEMRRVFEESCEQLPVDELLRRAIAERALRAQESQEEAYKQAAENEAYFKRFGHPDPWIAML